MEIKNKKIYRKESEIKVVKLEWKAVPMSKTSTRVGLGIGRGVLDVITLGIAEAGFRAQRWSHDIIKVYTECEKCGAETPYVLEYLVIFLFIIF